jgi:hypothetical protein
MKKTMIQAAFTAAACAMLGSAWAGDVTGVKVDATGTVGKPVTAVVQGVNEGMCGMRLEWGDGHPDSWRMNAGKEDYPKTATHVYQKAGTYTVTAKGGQQGSAFPCQGQATATVTIAEAPKPAAAAPAAGAATAAAAAAAAPSCPEGYALNKASVDKKSGAYSCKAGKGAKKPEKAMACPTGTEYFATPKGSQLGCKKAVAKK